MEAFILDIGGMRTAIRDRTTQIPNSAVYRKYVDDSMLPGECFICRQGWDIKEEVVTLRWECKAWAHEACMAKSVFETGGCSTCRKSIFLIDGVFILADAAKKGDIDEVRLQLEKGTPHSLRDLLDRTPLMQAAQHGHGDIVRLLLESGASPSDCDRYGQTALHLAVQSRSVDTVRVLVENGAPISVFDSKGNSALQLATADGDHEIIDLLHYKSSTC